MRTEAEKLGLTTYELIEIFIKLIGDIYHTVAIILWGPTGSGKSQIIRQVLARLSEGKNTWKPKDGVSTTGALELFGEWGLVDLRTSLLDPTDLRGLPDLNGTTAIWKAPHELPFVGQEERFPEKGVVFLDEVTHAPPGMQSACFSLVLDHRCGPHVLLPGWKVVAASNYASENGNTYSMSEPLRTRFEHYHLRVSLDAYKRWGNETNNLHFKVIAFLNSQPDYLHKPTESPEEAFPTPRGWASVSRSLQTFEGRYLENVIAAKIGPGAASMFHGFLEIFSRPELTVDIPSVLRKKLKPPKLSIEEPSIAWAFAASVVAHVKDKPELLLPAIEFLCSDTWKNALEMGRTGLSDVKHVVGAKIFAENVQPIMAQVQRRYGAML